MNLLKAVYCNQYSELKPKGKEAAARTNGTRLLAVGLALYIILAVVLLMVISESFADGFTDLIEDTFGRRRGRSIGKFVALIPFLISLPLIRYTLGREDAYNQMIAEYETLGAEEQKRISSKGLYFFLGSLAAFAIAFIMIFIFLA